MSNMNRGPMFQERRRAKNWKHPREGELRGVEQGMGGWQVIEKDCEAREGGGGVQEGRRKGRRRGGGGGG